LVICALFVTLSIQPFSDVIGSGSSCLGVQGSEQESNEQEYHDEANTHEDQSLHNEGVFLLID